MTADVNAPPTSSTRDARTHCNVCGEPAPERNEDLHAVPCHVRAFRAETFHLWRCRECRCLHCREVVDLDSYYAAYPFAAMTLTWPFRLFYRNLRRRMKKFGLRREHRILDYGCGNGLFVRYLNQRGQSAVGFDPYGATTGMDDRRVLETGPFDFVLLQDVLEHGEEPAPLLAKLDALLVDGGIAFIGTPNADRVDPSRPADFLNELHVPYHLHIYTRSAVEQFGAALGWRPVGFFDRPYHDTPWPGLNTRASKAYQQRLDGTMDALFEPIRPWRAVTSPRFLFFASYGYWLSTRSDMTVVFKKEGAARTPPSRLAD